MFLVRAIRGPWWFLGVLVTSLVPGQAPAADSSTAAREPTTLTCSEQRSIWTRIRAPHIEAFCAQMVFAQAAVWDEPRRAMAVAQAAERIYSRGLESRLVKGLALLVAGEASQSHALFAALEQVALREAGPTFRLAAARAALLSGNYVAALQHYRHLALGVEQLSGSRERARVLLEASIAVSYARPDGFDEARALIRQARGHFAPLLEPVASALELLLQVRYRSANSGEAAVAERYWELAWIVERTPRSRGAPGELLPVLPPGEQFALLAACADPNDGESQRALWSQFLLFAPDAPAHVRAAAASEGGGGMAAQSEED